MLLPLGWGETSEQLSRLGRCQVARKHQGSHTGVIPCACYLEGLLHTCWAAKCLHSWCSEETRSPVRSNTLTRDAGAPAHPAPSRAGGAQDKVQTGQPACRSETLKQKCPSVPFAVNAASPVRAKTLHQPFIYSGGSGSMDLA